MKRINIISEVFTSLKKPRTNVSVSGSGEKFTRFCRKSEAVFRAGTDRIFLANAFEIPVFFVGNTASMKLPEIYGTGWFWDRLFDLRSYF